MSYDSVTIITKILSCMKSYGCQITDKKYRQEQYSQKESKLKIKSFFEPAPEEEIETDDTSQDDKTYQQKQLEEELKALSNRDLFVRRGRNNRVFAKFINREIFREP